jgi:hypothetical protein
MSNKISLDDIFDDPDFNSIKSEKKVSSVKSEDDRLIDAFEEVNVFIDKNEREPSTSSMSEYGLMAKLKNFRQNEEQKKILKPFDRHNLLGHVELDAPSIDDVLNDDEFKELEAEDSLSIFKYKHTPKPEERAESDFVAQRKPLKEKDFKPYEVMFHKVHKEIKEGKRKIKPFKNAEKNLKEGHYYILDGLLLFLEQADTVVEEKELKSGSRVRSDGRTRTIFENGTYSNMLFRSLGKQILKNGKLITQSTDDTANELFINANLVEEEDVPSGWIYTLQTKSTHPELSAIKDLYKIGFSSTPVLERVKNARNEATYLFSDIKNLKAWKVYNRNADKLELLLHKFFAKACLDIDIENENGQRLNPREWFVVPFEVIEETIQLILNETIVNYEYDVETKRIKLKE